MRKKTVQKKTATPWELFFSLSPIEERNRYTPEPVSSRRLYDGMHVECGALNDAKVIETRESGKYGLVSHASGEICVVWTDVVPAAGVSNTKFYRNDLPRVEYSTRSVSDVLRAVLAYGVNATPIYQRDYVWTLSDKEKLIDSVFHGRDIGKLLFVRSADIMEPDEILDGKQRLEALSGFYMSRFPYRRRYFHELSKADRNSFLKANMQVGFVSGISERDKLKLFIALNDSGVPQTEEHIDGLKQLLQELESDDDNG